MRTVARWEPEARQRVESVDVVIGAMLCGDWPVRSVEIGLLGQLLAIASRRQAVHEELTA